jgi:hypothetical protein
MLTTTPTSLPCSLGLDVKSRWGPSPCSFLCAWLKAFPSPKLWPGGTFDAGYFFCIGVAALVTPLVSELPDDAELFDTDLLQDPSSLAML